MTKNKEIKEKRPKSDKEKLIDNKNTKVGNSKEHVDPISTDKESSSIIRVFNTIDIKKVNESMKFLASLGGIIVVLVTVFLEVRKSNLALEASDYFKIPKYYFMGSSNKITMSIYHLLIFSVILSLFLMPLVFKIFNKDKKISKTDFKFYSNLLSIFFAVVVTSRIMFLHISLSNFWNYIVALIIFIVSYKICEYIIKSFVVKFIGVIEPEVDNEVEFRGFFKDLFDKDNKFLLLYSILIVYISYALGNVFFGAVHPKDVRAYGYIDIDNDEINNSNIKDNEKDDNSNCSNNIKVIIIDINKTESITMDACIEKNEIGEKLIIYTGSYRKEKTDNKEINYRIFDEVEPQQNKKKN